MHPFREPERNKRQRGGRGAPSLPLVTLAMCHSRQALRLRSRTVKPLGVPGTS